MLMPKERRLPIRTLRGWAISVLQGWRHPRHCQPLLFRGSRRATLLAIPSALTRQDSKWEHAHFLSAGAFGIGGAKQIVVADYCAES
jgi:hypothetical protein